MQNIATVIFLLAVVTALAEVTDKVKIPYPILLVAAGIAMGMIPGLPNIAIDPEIIFLVFLPPILYGAAWETSWPDFKAAKRPITLLAIGCVIFTTCAVAWVAHTFIPNFGWAEAFVLGAIVSPPDAVAATAALKGLPVPKRVTTILEGESLVNDATGLIAYRYAVLAVTTGAFSLWAVGTQFLVVATGGIAIGLLCSWIFVWIHKITPDNSTNDTVLTFLAPFVAYLGAEAIHLSGVLAVVAAGLYMSQKSSEVYSQETRLQAYGSWDTVMFILNGVIFILIGLQLPEIVSNMGANSFWAWKYAIIISVAVIVGRLIWVYPATYIPRWLSKGIRERETSTNVKLTTIVAWSGMRGVVSLAAALALPLTGEGGADFPHRNLIIFITFSVIFSTLVLQGLTLRPLINVFGIENDGKDHEEEKKARLLIASSIIEHIEENYALGLSDEVLNQIKTKYEMRIQRLRKDDTQRMSEEQIVEFHRLQQELLDKERAEMLRFRRQGIITDEMLRKMEYELDLEETRLILEKSMV